MQPQGGPGPEPGKDERSGPDTTPATAPMDWTLLARIVGVAAAALLVLFGFAQTELFRTWIRVPSLELNASLSAVVLRLLGEDALADGNLLSSPRLTLTIYKGCDALEPFGFYVAAVVAFPAGFRRQLVGIVCGAAFMLLFNQVRIVSLYYVGIHHPSLFETMHREVWQAVFIALGLVLFLIWMQWTFWMHDRHAHARELSAA